MSDTQIVRDSEAPPARQVPKHASGCGHPSCEGAFISGAFWRGQQKEISGDSVTKAARKWVAENMPEPEITPDVPSTLREAAEILGDHHHDEHASACIEAAKILRRGAVYGKTPRREWLFEYEKRKLAFTEAFYERVRAFSEVGDDSPIYDGLVEAENAAEKAMDEWVRGALDNAEATDKSDGERRNTNGRASNT